jgi:hypothetical protein
LPSKPRARAALLYLKTQYPFEAWPGALIIQYERLFDDPAARERLV